MKLIDTSVWVHFLRRKGDAKVKQAVVSLLQADLAAHSCPIRFELLSGAKPDDERALEQALQLSHHLTFEQADWREAALLERELRARGLAIPRSDLFIMTVAMRHGVPVVCRDAHFDIVQKVTGSRLAVEQV